MIRLPLLIIIFLQLAGCGLQNLGKPIIGPNLEELWTKKGMGNAMLYEDYDFCKNKGEQLKYNNHDLNLMVKKLNHMKAENKEYWKMKEYWELSGEITHQINSERENCMLQKGYNFNDQDKPRAADGVWWNYCGKGGRHPNGPACRSIGK